MHIHKKDVSIRHYGKHVNLIFATIGLFISLILGNIFRSDSRISVLILAVQMIVLIVFIILFYLFYREMHAQVDQIYKMLSEENESAATGNADVKNLLPTELALNKTRRILSIIEDLESNKPFKDILYVIYDSFSDFIPYTHIGVALIDGSTIRASYGVSGRQHKNLSKKLLGYQTNIENTSLGAVIKSGKPRVINDLEEYLKGKKPRLYNRYLLDEGIKSSITFPLINNGVPVGIIFFSSNLRNAYREEHIDFLRVLANSLMLSLEKNILNDDMIVSSTLSMATLAEERDPETGGHLIRMKKYSRLIAELLGKERRYTDIIDFDYINAIERFSPLHDIGKVAIRDNILLKPGKLTAEEFEIMKTHTTYGARVLRLADKNLQKMGRSVFKMGIEIAEGHHEKWDGSGYPFGKKETAIPLCARIVAVADVLDALTSKRVYKEAYAFETAIDMIFDESGRQFDPSIIKVMEKNKNIIKNHYEILNQN